MLSVFRGLMLVFLSVTLVACNKNLTKDELSGDVAPSDYYYTQVVMHYEKNAIPTTNYQVGSAIPINTQVKLLEINKKIISIEVVNDHQQLQVKNMIKHTGDDTQQAFNKLFAKQKLNLGQFSSLEVKNINEGKVVVGMGKKAVIAAIGYPPITRTANLDVNSWVYWRNRFNTFIVNFKNNKVAEVVD